MVPDRPLVLAEAGRVGAQPVDQAVRIATELGERVPAECRNSCASARGVGSRGRGGRQRRRRPQGVARAAGEPARVCDKTLIADLGGACLSLAAVTHWGVVVAKPFECIRRDLPKLAPL
eukprot:2728522-Pleurochrysis_carterae.AAC.1